MRTRKLTLSALLTALALLLSLLERLIPLPVSLPGVKLGLSNIVTLFALYTLGAPYAAGILLLRIVLGSVFSGSVTALLYALSGGALSLFVMLLMRRSDRFSLYGVSVLGAAAHNVGQVTAAAAVLGSVSVFGYLPLLLLVSVVTGLLIGFVTDAVWRVCERTPLFHSLEKEDRP